MKPNIILITTDQQRKDSLGCYGADYVDTPNIDRLAKEGIQFDRAYCTNPVCTPSRASLMTGRYVSNHGAWNIGTSVPDDVPMLSQRLSENGYYCHSVGKCHWQPNTADDSHESLNKPEFYKDWNGPYYGFDTIEIALGHPGYDLIAGHYADWVNEHAEGIEDLGHMSHKSKKLFGGEAQDRKLPTALHSSTWCGDRAINFIEAHDSDEPFFLNIGFPDPHHPHAVPLDYDRRVNPEDVPQPRYTQGELDDKPFFFREARVGKLEASSVRGEFPMAGQGEGHSYRNISEKDASEARAYYYTMVHMIDDQIGRILESLERQELLENTIIIFTTDHGELLGDHGLWMKGPFHYEELINVPLIISSPGLFGVGQKSQTLVSLVDLYPTILSLLNLEVGKTDGISQLGALTGHVAPSGRESVLVECFDDLAGLRLHTLVTERYKFTVYQDNDFGELYDLLNDPGELHNLWNDPAYALLHSRLEKELLKAKPSNPRFGKRTAYS